MADPATIYSENDEVYLTGEDVYISLANELPASMRSLISSVSILEASTVTQNEELSELQAAVDRTTDRAPGSATNPAPSCLYILNARGALDAPDGVYTLKNMLGDPYPAW